MKRRTRRLGRILFNTLTAISLLLAIATAGLWVRSGFCIDLYVHRFQTVDGLKFEALEFGMNQGFVFVNARERTFDKRFPKKLIDRELEVISFRRSGYHQQSNSNVSGWRRWIPTAGVFYSGELNRLNLHTTTRGVPLWLPLALFLIMPSIRISAFFRKRRIVLGLCPACGYDTRANPAKCSECGHELSELANRTRNGT